MKSSSTKWGKHSTPSTPSVDTVASFLSEVDIAALKVEIDIDDLLRGELPPVIREVLDHTVTQSRQWRQSAWGCIQALTQAEVNADMIADGVNPNDPAAADKWFADEQQKRNQQGAKRRASKGTGPEADETGVKGDA